MIKNRTDVFIIPYYCSLEVQVCQVGDVGVGDAEGIGAAAKQGVDFVFADAALAAFVADDALLVKFVV